MKFIKIVLSIFPVSCLLMSCLKDKNVDERITGIVIDEESKIVEIMAPVSGLVVTSLDPATSETTFTAITTRLAAKEPAQKDIQVTLQLVPEAVSGYNTAHGTSYDLLPANLYTIPSLTVTIPKGSRTADLKLKTVPNNLAGHSYAIGFKIASASDPSVIISGNHKKAVAAVGAKSRYDGVYSLTIKTSGWSAYGISDGPTRSWPTNVHLVTVNANTVSYFDPSGGSVLQPAFTTAGGTTAFGAATPSYSFDLSNDKLISVVNTTADDGRGRTFKLNTNATVNGYDPGTKKIYAAYLMTQNGRPDQEIYMTFTYVGRR